MSAQKRIAISKENDDFYYQFSIDDIDHDDTMQTNTSTIEKETQINDVIESDVKAPQNSFIVNKKNAFALGDIQRHYLESEANEHIIFNPNFQNCEETTQYQNQTHQQDIKVEITKIEEHIMKDPQQQQRSAQKPKSAPNKSQTELILVQQIFIKATFKQTTVLSSLSLCRVFQFLLFIFSFLYKFIMYAYIMGFLEKYEYSRPFKNVMRYDPGELKHQFLIDGGIFFSITSVIVFIIFNTTTILNIKNQELIRSRNICGLKIASFFELTSFILLQTFLWTHPDLIYIIGIGIFTLFLSSQFYYIIQYTLLQNNINKCMNELKIDPYSQSVIV